MGSLSGSIPRTSSSLGRNREGLPNLLVSHHILGGSLLRGLGNEGFVCTMSVISFGAGVNSVAMTIILVNNGWRGPIVFADTGTEWPETYCYLEYFEREWLKPRGLGIIRLGEAYRALGPGRDRRTLIKFCEDYRTTPMAGMRWCTQGWKTDVINYWCKKHGETEQLLAIAFEERHRQKGRLCPLIDMQVDRKQCIMAIEAEGLQIPQKSTCYICPFQGISRWRRLYETHPDLYERAAKLEEASAERRHERTCLMADGRYTLRQLEIVFRDQLALFDDDLMDSLEIYRPCVCSL